MNQPIKETIEFSPGEGFARQLDRNDELASFREDFVFHDPHQIYLDGNSLGRLSRQAVKRLQEVIELEWGRDLILGWNKGWYQAPERVGEKIAGLLGAAPGQVLVSDSTSVNLFKLAAAALQLRPGRSRIVSDSLNFPSDLYILQGLSRLLDQGHQLVQIPCPDEIEFDTTEIEAAIDEQTALVALSQVSFKSGFLYDVEVITEKAHRQGALVLWDLSHSAGVVPIELDRWEVDLAVGCSYKYLNGGPGAPAYLYIRKELQEQALSPIWGWFGQKSPFAFATDYTPAAGAQRFLAGSPPILSLLALEPGLDLLDRAGIARLRQKSMLLTSYLVYLIDTRLAQMGFSLGSPRDASRRGSHVSIRHPEGYRINRALIEEMQVLPDFREPDNIRLGLSPLYCSFQEIWEAVDRICTVVSENRYQKYSAERQMVT
jgi:kynureninase